MQKNVEELHHRLFPKQSDQDDICQVVSDQDDICQVVSD